MIDTILYNGDIVTLDPKTPRVSALAIHGEYIVAWGSDDEIRSLATPKTRLYDLDGRMIIPGLTDAHLHWSWTAQSLRMVDLFEVPTKHEALQRVASHIQNVSPEEWVTGRGWTQDIWSDKAFPSAQDLDAVAPQNPVFLTAKSGHAAWVNSFALRLAGVDEHTPDPDGGKIGRDEQGYPNGMLFETAINLVRQHIPSPSPDALADMMLEAQQLALASGLTGFHDYDGSACFAALQILRQRGKLSMRVVKNINLEWIHHAQELGLRWGFGDEWLRIGGLKIFADGALGPRTAYMIEPYEGEPDNYGIATIDKEEMTEAVSKASLAGIPSTIHAIGDRAVHDVLDVYEVVRKQESQRGVSSKQMRHRIEHVQLIHPDDRYRLAELDIIASMQPIHATSDYDMAQSYWGERSRWAYNARLQLDAGVVVAFGSDSPVEPFHPFKGIHAAVTRRRPDGSPGPDGWYPELRLSLDEALRAYTQGPAYAAGLEHKLGKLAPGYLADLVVLDRDIYTIPAMELLEVEVIATMVGGVWRHGEI